MILEWLLVITLAVGISIGWIWLGVFLAHWCVVQIVVRSHLCRALSHQDQCPSQHPSHKRRVGYVRWVGINGAVWYLTSRGFGTLPNMRALACQPPESVLRAINGLRIPILRADGRPEMTQDESGADAPAHHGLTMVESIQV